MTIHFPALSAPRHLPRDTRATLLITAALVLGGCGATAEAVRGDAVRGEPQDPEPAEPAERPEPTQPKQPREPVEPTAVTAPGEPAFEPAPTTTTTTTTTARHDPAASQPPARRPAEAKLQNDALARLCRGGDSGACVRLATRFVVGEGVPQNLDGGLALLRRACELGRGEGCAVLARMFDAGGAAGHDAARSQRWRERACKLRDGGSCAALGTVAWRAGRFEQARVHFETACAVEHAAGCFGLAVLHARGEGVPNDAARAAALHQQACELGHARACRMLAERHDRGLGVPRDPAKAAFWRQRACALDPGSCPDKAAE